MIGAIFPPNGIAWFDGFELEFLEPSSAEVGSEPLSEQGLRNLIAFTRLDRCATKPGECGYHSPEPCALAMVAPLGQSDRTLNQSANIST